MTYQENRTIAYLISTLLALGLYSFLVIQKYQEGSFNSTTISSFWGSLILVVIVVQIVLSIIMSILASIIQAIATREEEFIQSDERDQLIDLKANRISFAVIGIGFVLAMITLAIGLPPLVMFNLIVFSLFGAGIVGYISQLYLYRRGF
jgi:uncharacterized membrane protein